MNKICEYCGIEFECTSFQVSQTKYCSKYCKAKKSRTLNNDKIKQGQKRCYERRREYYIQKSKENKEKNPDPLERLRVFHYKGQTIRFQFEIRCGVCNLCRAVEKIDTYSTQRHHDNDVYFDEDPLKNTIEVCVNCHAVETFTSKERIDQRCCSLCNSTKTLSFSKYGKIGYYWHNYKGGKICQYCYNKTKKHVREIENQKEKTKQKLS